MTLHRFSTAIALRVLLSWFCFDYLGERLLEPAKIPVSLPRLISAGVFLSFNMNDTSCHAYCQDVSFMNFTSMIEDNQQEQEKSPLRLLREEAGLTRPQVKQIIGVSERRQADWESGKAMPSAENIASLCRLYKVSLKTMFKSLGIDVSSIPNDE
uniref:Putative transcription factor n=3 Tax=Nostocales TaxID=1161 RepID=Q6GZZ7_MICDP|nr:putative transcription factor [Fremyella diplosiphon Fd33]